jgi:hypothetical protein
MYCYYHCALTTCLAVSSPYPIEPTSLGGSAALAEAPVLVAGPFAPSLEALHGIAPCFLRVFSD